MENIYFNKKRYFTVLLILTLLLCSFVLIGLNKKSNNSYAYPDCNVILISIDALRPDHLGCYGYHRNTSPYIDKLAQKSIVFENAFSHIPRTLSSHMTMLTSLYPSVHGIVQPQDESPVPTLPDSIITLPQILKKEGYATGNFTFLPGECGFHKGFNMIVQEDLLTGYSFRTEEMFQWIEENKDNKFFLFFHTYVAHAPYMSEYSARFTGKK